MNGRSFNFNARRQSGVFVVEFALIAPVIALVLVFATDMVGKQTLKGRLEVLSYSAVSLIKERTELYPDSEKVTSKEAGTIYQIVKASMRRTMSDFKDKDKQMGFHLEQLLYDADEDKYTTIFFNKNSIDVDTDIDIDIDIDPTLVCEPVETLQNMTDLHIKTSWNRPVSLYQVTLCYKDNNGFVSLVGEDYSLIKANAIMLGR